MTRIIDVGGVKIGGGEPIRVQSMTNTYTKDIDATVSQINELEKAGCEIVRVTIPDMVSAVAIKEIKKRIKIPLVADIHFDYRLAVESIKRGADKIRINPGNIGSVDRISKVVDEAKKRNIPIRIGVNSGSIDREIVKKYGRVNKYAVLESIERSMGQIFKFDYENIVVSIKSSDIFLNYESNKIFSEKYDFPIHIGITEAGGGTEGIVKSSIGISMLLNENIGDTIRVSLTDNPVEEIYAAFSILKVLRKRNDYIEFISCPTCGRTNVDLISISQEIKEKLRDVKKDIKVAIMGCAVNGPGEAREADIGIAGGKGEFLLFKRGKIIAKLDEKNVVDRLIKEIKGMR